MLLETRNLEIGYGAFLQKWISLLPPLNLKLHSGELVALVGPNGAGKSTLLRTIAGIQTPLQGEVFQNGKSLNAIPLREKAKMVSVVLTHLPDDPFLKVIDIVMTGRFPYTDFWNRIQSIDEIIVEKSLKATGISHLKERKFVNLSDGEKQKVFISKPLAQDTPLILLDEPAAFLDYPSKMILMQLLLKLCREQHKTILFSSHDLDLVMRTADKIWLMGNHEELVEGIPESLALDGHFNRFFDNEKVQFELVSGRFITVSHIKKSVYVQGEHVQVFWLRHAVLRLGFHLTSREVSDIQLYRIEEGFRFVANEKEIIINDFNLLIQYLSNEIPKNEHFDDYRNQSFFDQ